MINRTVSSTLALAAGLALWSGPALAQDTNTSPDAPVSTTPVTANSDDIIVTAIKRPERLRDVALPVSVVTGDQLAKANANSLSDYITRLPGVVFNDYQPGISEVVIRGVAATTYHEQGQTTVGYYLNDIPLVEPGFPIAIPDIDTFDLDQVAVLRGPQGTRFGSSTLGGLVNYIVKTADPTGFHAAAESAVSTTRHSAGEVNYAGKLMLNVPIITDKLAVRVMALQRFDAGFANNTGVGVRGSNDARTRGLRGSIVWTPTPDTKVTYLGTYQDTKLDDQTYLTDIADLTRVTQHLEPQKTSFFLNSLRLDQDLGFANLTVFGSVDEKTNTTVFDSSFYGFLTGVTTGPNSPISLGHATANIKQVEARLASSGTGPFSWLIGTSFIHSKKFSYDRIIAPGAQAALGAALAPGDRIYGYISNTSNDDFGVFGELSYKPVDALELTVGGRYFDTKAKASVTNQAGYVSGSTVDLSGGLNKKEDGFTPKATVTVRPTHDFLAYLTYSRGFRVGGINPNAGLLPTIANSYDSDKVDNYEMGSKFGLFDNRLRVEAAVFSLDWHDIQARLFGPAPNFYSYVINAASANIAGVEMQGVLKLSRNLTVSSNATYQDAKLTAFLPDTFAPGGGHASGTRLPGSSKWTVANNVVLDFPDMEFTPTFEFAHRYLSKAPVAFDSDAFRGGFSQFDVRASVTVMERVRLLAFANNIFDKRGLLNGPFAGATAPAYSIIRPRTIGIRADVGF